jgi:TolB-like protein/tetratricopeptide (TPR) repeat protein
VRKTEPALVDPASVRAELAHILESRAFQASDRHRNFLTFVVNETLGGRAHTLKEYCIGVEVFGKGESFDPRIDTIVRVEARKLRSRIAKYYEDEGGRDPVRIELVKGSYAPVFHFLDEEPPQSLPGSEDVALPTAPVKGFLKHARSVGIALLVAIGVVTAYRLSRPRASANVAPSIAVLPFANLGAENNEFFSDGLTDELIDSLGRVPGLRVVGRTSSFRLKGKNLDLREIGRQLNVRTVLEGSVRQSGSRLRITAELDETATGYRLWSESYDRDISDVIEMQKEISTAITNTLGRGLTGSALQPAIFGSSAPLNSDAYQDYLRGRYFWNRSTLADVKTAMALFQRSIDRGPNYAPAYVGLAATYLALPLHTATTERELAPKIRAAANKALKLDPGLGEAHFDLGRAFAAEFNWRSAEAEFKRGLELSPNNAVAHRWYSIFLWQIGRNDESLAEARRALDLDPVSLPSSSCVGEVLYRLKRYDEAAEQFRKTLGMDANYGFARLGLGLTYLQQGKRAEGLKEVLIAHQLLQDDRSNSKLAYAYAVNGDSAAAHEILHQFLRQTQNGHFKSVFVADVYLGLGDRNAALDWLSRSIDEGDSPPLLDEPSYEPIRLDARFIRLMARMNLPSVAPQ